MGALDLSDKIIGVTTQLMNKRIAKVLRQTGNPGCIEKAKALESDGYQAGTLNLRGLSLKPEEVMGISEVLQPGKGDGTDRIRSISFSYNDQIGDTGAIALSKSLPSHIREVGLVGCGIGDEGGSAILNWMKTNPNLEMICIEQNHFSDQLKAAFMAFKRANPEMVVVY
ncbi:MAG: hypothetical protein RIC19_11685 [Phaeodactylibacter sp.]|uniref:hypothetical protein n=1 Tax=Phaeodactylibacter sp. TaxID=1940289 RepID=UPI0032EDB32B